MITVSWGRLTNNVLYARERGDGTVNFGHRSRSVGVLLPLRRGEKDLDEDDVDPRVRRRGPRGAEPRRYITRPGAPPFSSLITGAQQELACLFLQTYVHTQPPAAISSLQA